MRKMKWSAALLILVALCTTAFAESGMGTIVDAVEKLAFETHNVTITGQAEFLLDGERFKTAEITYVQDGQNSFWQEKLFTPREWRSDRETGFTVIANEQKIFVMEPYTPGVYREGYDEPQNTLLRKTPMAETLFGLTRAATEQLAPSLADWITVVEQEEGAREIQIAWKKEQVPAMFDYIANLGIQFAARRVFGVPYDTTDYNGYDLDDFYTPTWGILCGTERYSLNDSSIQMNLDGTNRLTGAKGTLAIGLKTRAGDDRLLRINFDLTVSGYGDSKVKTFNPADYGVVPIEEWNGVNLHTDLSEEKRVQITNHAKEIVKAAGYAAEEAAWIFGEDGLYALGFPQEDGECTVTITEDGIALHLNHEMFLEGWTEHPSELKELEEEHSKRILEFLHQANPNLPIDELKPEWQLKDGDTWVIGVTGPAKEGEESEIMLTVRILPEWKIEYYTCEGNG